MSPIGTGDDARDVSRGVCLVQNATASNVNELRVQSIRNSCVDVCDVNVRVCDPKIEDGTIREMSNRPRFSSMMADIYRYIPREATSSRLPSSSLFYFFFPASLCPACLAWPRSAQQRETTRAINDFFRRWANLCVSCDLLLYSCPSSLHPLFVLRSFRAVPRDRELPLCCRASYFT